MENYAAALDEEEVSATTTLLRAAVTSGVVSRRREAGGGRVGDVDAPGVHPDRVDSPALAVTSAISAAVVERMCS